MFMVNDGGGFRGEPAGVINSGNKQGRLGCSHFNPPDESYKGVFLNHSKQVPMMEYGEREEKESPSPTSVLNKDQLPFSILICSRAHTQSLIVFR